MEIANNFLTTIIKGLEETPYGIRWICKQIRSLTRRKYPDAQDQTICTLIGGFFFLRFINPAIVTPRSYMLIDVLPAENPKRTLTYIAKMLQNLANKPSYAKEPYMVKLQPFIHQNKERINKFLLDLCEVQDFYDTLEMDNYVALSKKDLELSITLNEVYATHSLLERHAAELVSKPEASMRIIKLTSPGQGRQFASGCHSTGTRYCASTASTEREPGYQSPTIQQMGNATRRSHSSAGYHARRDLLHGSQVDIRYDPPLAPLQHLHYATAIATRQDCGGGCYNKERFHHGQEGHSQHGAPKPTARPRRN
jgi:hypothetical protein